MGKKNRNKATTTGPFFGLPLGFKHLGKPLHVAFAIYDAAHIAEVHATNSEEFSFRGLEQHPTLYGVWDENVKNLLTSQGKDKALGLMILSTPEALEWDGKATTATLPGETLPFRTGTSRLWRNPKVGALIAEDDDEPNVLARHRVAEEYAAVFPNFDAVYTIEQIVDPAGISDSMDLLLHKTILKIVNS